VTEAQLARNNQGVTFIPDGNYILVYGWVREGHSAMEQSMRGGESLPVEKTPGNEVFGSTLNKMGSFLFEAAKVGCETTLAQIIKLAEEAQAPKAPIERLADRIAGVFVPIVIGLGALMPKLARAPPGDTNNVPQFLGIWRGDRGEGGVSELP
jgi:cation transport ATPase